MSVSHGYNTIGGIECGGGCEEKKEEMVTLTRRIKELWRFPLIDINVNEYGLPYKGCTRAISM